MSSSTNILKEIAAAIENFNEWVGRIAAWLASLMVLCTIFIVIAQGFFRKAAFYHPYSRLFDELVIYMFSALFMFGIAYTLKHDDHVRVDIFYRRFSEKNKALVNLLGTLLFLFPVCGIIFYYSFDWVADSWRDLEGSKDPGGIDFVFGLRSLVIIMPVLVALQGIAMVINNLLILTNQHKPQE